MLDGIAIVTGAGSGIGRECALAFAFAGVTGVVFADRNFNAAQDAAESSHQVAKSASYHPLAVAVDVTNRGSVDAMVSQTLGKFGRIDYCVNAAGVSTGHDKVAMI